MLSGFLFKHVKSSYSGLLKNKVKRLVYPFITTAVIFFLVKFSVGIFINIEHPIEVQNVYMLLVDPLNSYMPLLWFVHALFLIYVIYPLVRRALSNNFAILLLFIKVNMMADHDLLGISKVLANLPFFVFGVLLREQNKLFAKVAGERLYIVVTASVFILIFLFHDYLGGLGKYSYFERFLLGVSGTLFVINISNFIGNLADVRGKHFLIEIGYYSMSIYLFHTFFESGVRIGFLQILSFMQIRFEIVAITAITAGIIFPLVFEKLILKKNAVTKKYALGLA